MEERADRVISRSIRTQFSIIFAALLLGMMLLCLFVNNVFLEKYYKRDKCLVLEETYSYLDDMYSEGDEEDSEEFDAEFEHLCNTNNVAVLVVNASLETVKASMHEDKDISMRLFSYIFKDDPNYLFLGPENPGGEGVSENGMPGPHGQPSPDDKNFKDKGKEASEGGRGRRDDMTGQVYKETDNYVIMTSRDPRLGTDYIELMGTLSNGHLVMIRTAVESIKESAKLANRFLLYVGISVGVMGLLLIYLVTRKITDPILTLAEISRRMTNLDFEARYTGDDKDEIGYLGAHMNELSATLEKTISELKTANNELKVDLEKREQIDDMRSDFISNVSHELKTPLAIIQGYAEGLKEGINDDPEGSEFYCDVIIDEAAKMNKMVQNLLKLNHLEFGRDIVTMEHFDLAALLRNYLSSATILTEKTDVKIEVQCPESLYVWGDEYHIEEVLTNYFSNAVHYVKKDGCIRICLESRDGSARLSVFNSGEPISAEAGDKIWDKFYKADKARSREYGGSGVGLSIVKAIMEAHHKPYGYTNLEDGVEFWFELDCK